MNDSARTVPFYGIRFLLVLSCSATFLSITSNFAWATPEDLINENPVLESPLPEEVILEVPLLESPLPEEVILEVPLLEFPLPEEVIEDPIGLPIEFPDPEDPAEEIEEPPSCIWDQRADDIRYNLCQATAGACGDAESARMEQEFDRLNSPEFFQALLDAFYNMHRSTLGASPTPRELRAAYIRAEMDARWERRRLWNEARDYMRDVLDQCMLESLDCLNDVENNPTYIC